MGRETGAANQVLLPLWEESVWLDPNPTPYPKCTLSPIESLWAKVITYRKCTLGGWIGIHPLSTLQQTGERMRFRSNVKRVDHFFFLSLFMGYNSRRIDQPSKYLWHKSSRPISLLEQLYSAVGQDPLLCVYETGSLPLVAQSDPGYEKDACVFSDNDWSVGLLVAIHLGSRGILIK